MEAISGRKLLQEIAADHALHPIQVSQWMQQLLESASELFTRGEKTQAKDEIQAKDIELFQSDCFPSRWLCQRKACRLRKTSD